jgi:hypothetical protein
MSYEIFERKTTRVVEPAVTFSPQGRLAFNANVCRLFHKIAVENVLLQLDREQRKVALRPIAKKDARSYKVSYAKVKTGCNVSGKAFLDWAKIDYSKVRTYPAQWNENEGLLEIVLPREAFKDSPRRIASAETRKQPVSAS